MTPTPAKVKILFIEASPPDHSRLDTGTERAHAEDALWASLNPEVFEVLGRSAAHPHELESYLRRRQPRVIHFSGHGNHWGDLILSASDGATSHPLRGEDFAEKLCRYAEHAPQVVRLVVLAGCYTEHAAQLASACVDCAIGMADEVEDVAMVDVFTPTLYRALGDGCSVAAAVKEAEQALRTHQPRQYTREADAVRLYTRQGVEGAKWKLTGLAAPAPALSPAHRKYLQRLLRPEWAGVTMALFDRELSYRLDLLDIFTPLPVDFVIHAQQDKNGAFDWRGARRTETSGRPQAEDADAQAQHLQEAGGKNRDYEARNQRLWADLGAAGDALAPLAALAQQALEAKIQRKPERERGAAESVTWEADTHHAALVQQRFVLVGAPGSGKSTFLRHLAKCWAGATLRDAGIEEPGVGPTALAGWTGKTPTPIYLELRKLVTGNAWDLDRIEPPGVADFEEYLRSVLQGMGCADLTAELTELLKSGEAALLLDGLDEVAQASHEKRRGQIKMFVASLVREYPAAPIIITARPYAYGQDDWRLPHFGFTQLTQLNRDRQRQLAERILATLAKENPALLPAGVKQEQARFARALDKLDVSLAANPLLLTLLMAIWFRSDKRDRSLPKTRGELYHRGLHLLLYDWVRQKDEDAAPKKRMGLTAADPTAEDLFFVLQLVAFQAQAWRSTDDQPAVIKESALQAAFAHIRKGDIAADALKYFKEQVGLLLDHAEKQPTVLYAAFDGEFVFLHPTFQEYLAACECLYREYHVRPYQAPIVDRAFFPDGLAGHVRAAPGVWANVLAFAIDELLRQGRERDAWELIRCCCAPYQRSSEALEAAVRAFEAAESRELFQIPLDDGTAGFHQRIQKAAEKLLLDHVHALPAQRDAAGRLLGMPFVPGEEPDKRARAGHDLRPGVGLRPDGLPDIAWVEIADDGPFTYQKDERRTERPFWIAKYPITYAQYSAFLADKDGFYNPEWWHGLDAPEEDRKQHGKQWFKYWNHPAENVSWYDAVAFCRWLTAQVKTKVEAKVDGWEALLPKALIGTLDWRITLPTEWQWEKAARGRDGRQYPWGPKYKEGYANIDERYGNAGSHYLQKTSAVGMYPHEKPQDSPYGVADLSGNVWEWCVTKYDKPDDPQPEQGSESRVLRGGSWGYDAVFAAASLRSWYDPFSRFINFGFRVVVAGGVPFSSAL